MTNDPTLWVSLFAHYWEIAVIQGVFNAMWLQLRVRAKATQKTIIKQEASRSEGDYQRKVRLARLCAMRGRDVV